MPNGKTTEVLSPVVYLAHNDNRQQPEMNSIVSANNIAINTKNTINNSGLVTANNTLALASEKNIVNSFGDISSTNKDGKVSLHAKENIDDISAKISGADVDINADKNVSITTNLSVNQGLNATNINMDGVADISGGNVKIKSGKDIVTSAANINATNKISMEAQGNLELGATTTREEKNIHGDLGSHVNKAKEQTNGTQISSNGDIELIGKQGVTTQAANVETDGKLQVMSDKDVVIGDASQHMSTDFNDTHKDSNLLNSHYEQKTEKTSEENSEGSSISADSIHIVAGHDVDVAGSEVVASHDVKIDATNNLAITAGRNVYEESTSHTEKTSGLTMDGASLNLGLENDEKKEEVKQVTHNSSTIASLEGNVSMSAGQHYGQSGSSVLANTGNIKITAKDVDIVHEKDTVDSNQSSKHEKIGISAGVSSDVVSSLQGIQSTVSNYKKTDSKRAKALAALTAASQVYDLASMKTFKDVDASVSLGASKQESQSEQHDSTVKSSSVKAGGDITIEATGAGKDSDVTIIGSDVQAGKNTHLKADNRVDILAGQNTHSSTSSNKSVGGSIGYSAQKGWNGSLSAGYGTSDGDSVHQVNSHVQSARKTDIESGGDTKIQGGIVSGKQVNADVGGDLNIESLQDHANYTSKEINVGIDISVKQGVGVDLGLGKTDGAYAGVDEQSGIKVGDKGFNVHVKGNTDLKGAVIASSDKAANEGVNNLVTGTLTTSDINNYDHRQSSSFSANIATGGGSSLGIAQDKHTQEPTITASGVSAGQITITNEVAQKKKNNKTAENTISDLKRDVTSEKDGNQKLSQSWSEDSLRKEQENVDTQAKIMQTFGAQAAKEIGTAASDHCQKLKDEAAITGDPKKRAELIKAAAKWEEGGEYRVALHMAAGALAGNVSGAVGAGASAYSSDIIKNKLDSMKMPAAVKGLLGQALAAGIGAAVGGSTGAVTSVNQYSNNRMLHDLEKEALAEFQKGKSDEEKLRLADAACYIVKCSAGLPDDHPNKAESLAAEQRGAQDVAEQKMFQQYGEQKMIESMRQNADVAMLASSGYGTFPVVDNQMFAYTGMDQATDAFTRNNGGVRAQGALNGVLGTTGVVAGGATAETGAGVALAAYSADYAVAGFHQMYTGKEANTLGEKALGALGVSQKNAALIYAAPGVMLGGTQLVKVGIKGLSSAAAGEETIINSMQTGTAKIEASTDIVKNSQIYKDGASYPLKTHTIDDALSIAKMEANLYKKTNYNVPNQEKMDHLEGILTKDAISTKIGTTSSGGVRVESTLKDGTKVQIRNTSKTGGKTIDIINSENLHVLKIHIAPK